MIIKQTFIEQLKDSKHINNKYISIFNSLSNDINNIPSFIFYGPPGVGKYTDVLKLLNKYSPSHLSYEKKIIINTTKNEHTIKISDIHYEINMENLTCNSKILFNDIYNHICDVIESSTIKYGFIVCKNFHSIDNELLEFFYSYMQKNINSNIKIRFILLTENYSFIPNNIIDVCKILYYSKLSITNYIKLANKNNKKFILDNKNININSINTIKYINLNKDNINILNLKKSLCDKLINIIKNNKIEYNNIRNLLYNILIYNLNLYDCIQYIIFNIIENLNNQQIFQIFIRTGELFKYYNNNYRPIYHLEAFILYLIKIVNGN